MLDDRHDYMYLRLSKEDGDVEIGAVEESCSIASQRSCVKRYVNNHFPEATDFEEIVDDGFSGTNMNRPGIRKLLSLVKAGHVRTIIVRDLSRFARNYLEAGHYLEFVFPVFDVRFISINDSFDSNVLGESTGGLELAIRNLINELYSKDISRKIKSVVDMKKLNGEYVYGTAPYGYKKGPKKNTIIIDEEVCRNVKRIFLWASEGLTITQIAEKMNREHIVTPSVYLSSIRGKYKTRDFWTFESVRNILTNRVYTGDTEPFKSHVVRVGSNHVKQIPPELRQVIPNTHEGIITRELFYQAQVTIKSNKKSKPNCVRNPMTSMLICACCGNRLTKGKAQNKYWLCSSARYQQGLECNQIRLSDQRIKEIVLHSITLQCQLLSEKIERIGSSTALKKDKRQFLLSECTQSRRKIERAQTEKMRLYEGYTSGSIGKEEYLLRKHEIVKQEDEYKAALMMAERSLNEIEEYISARNKGVIEASRFIRFESITELTPELTKELIKEILVYPDGNIKIVWNFRDDVKKLVELEQIERLDKVI